MQENGPQKMYEHTTVDRRRRRRFLFIGYRLWCTLSRAPHVHPSPSPAPPLQAELRKGIRLFKYSRRAQRKVPRVLSIDKTMSKLIWTPPMLGRTMRIATVHHVYRGQRTRSFRDVPRDRRGVEECCFSLVGVRQLNFEVASIKLRCVSFCVWCARRERE